jgi:hypothetical protein
MSSYGLPIEHSQQNLARKFTSVKGLWTLKSNGWSKERIVEQQAMRPVLSKLNNLVASLKVIDTSECVLMVIPMTATISGSCTVCGEEHKHRLVAPIITEHFSICLQQSDEAMAEASNHKYITDTSRSDAALLGETA